MFALQWLNAPMGSHEQRISRLAELMILNGETMDVTEVGNSRASDNVYGRIGLQPHEALELMYLRGGLEALIALEPGKKILALKEIQRAIEWAKGKRVQIYSPSDLRQQG